MIGGVNTQDFPMKLIKLVDNKVYKGTDIQEYPRIEKLLMAYEYNQQNIKRFRLSNLRRKNNLFEDQHIQVGCISDIIFDYMNQQNYLKLTIFIGNKTRQALRNMQIEFDGQENSYVYLKGDRQIGFIPAKTQEKFEIIVGYRDVPYSLVNMDISGELGEIEDNVEKKITVFIPNLLTKYLQFKDLDSLVFRSKWRELSQNILKTDIFTLSKHIIKTPAYFRRFFSKILELTSLEQFLSQDVNQYDIKYYKLGALIELADTESEFLIKFNIRPDNTLCIQIIALNQAFNSTATSLLHHLKFLFQA